MDIGMLSCTPNKDNLHSEFKCHLDVWTGFPRMDVGIVNDNVGLENIADKEVSYLALVPLVSGTNAFLVKFVFSKTDKVFISGEGNSIDATGNRGFTRSWWPLLSMLNSSSARKCRSASSPASRAMR